MPITIEQVQAQWVDRNALLMAMTDTYGTLLAFEEVVRDTVNANALTTQEGINFLQAYQSKVLGSVPVSYPTSMITDYRKFVETCEANGYSVTRQTVNNNEVITVSPSA